MVIRSEFHTGTYRDDDHREDASHFTDLYGTGFILLVIKGSPASEFSIWHLWFLGETLVQTKGTKYYFY